MSGCRHSRHKEELQGRAQTIIGQDWGESHANICGWTADTAGNLHSPDSIAKTSSFDFVRGQVARQSPAQLMNICSSLILPRLLGLGQTNQHISSTKEAH